ncbi:hypothetical protein TB2_031301 [Malus domestica]
MPSTRASGLLSLMRRRRTGKPSRPLTLALSPNKGKIVCFVSLSVPPDPQETFDPAPSPPNLRANHLPQGPKPPGQSFSGIIDYSVAPVGAVTNTTDYSAGGAAAVDLVQI